MKRIFCSLRIIGIIFLLMFFCGFPAVSACSGCSENRNTSSDKKTENTCFACKRDIHCNGKPVEVEHGEMIFCFCSEECADTFNQNPEKCFRDNAHRK